MNKPELLRTVLPKFKARYENFIGGRWVEPAAGRYFENRSPVNGQLLCEIARSDATAGYSASGCLSGAARWKASSARQFFSIARSVG